MYVSVERSMYGVSALWKQRVRTAKQRALTCQSDEVIAVLDHLTDLEVVIA